MRWIYTATLVLLMPNLGFTQEFPVHIEILDGRFGAASLFEVFLYRDDWGLPSKRDIREICRIMESCSGVETSPDILPEMAAMNPH